MGNHALGTDACLPRKHSATEERGCAGGRRGGAEPPDYDRVVARLSRRLGLAPDVIEDQVTTRRWFAYEDDWVETPHIDDLAAAYWGFYKSKKSVPIPM